MCDISCPADAAGVDASTLHAAGVPSQHRHTKHISVLSTHSIDTLRQKMQAQRSKQSMDLAIFTLSIYNLEHQPLQLLVMLKSASHICHSGQLCCVATPT
jgi:hypothetical protein